LVLQLLEINCHLNQRETGTQIEQNRKNQKPHDTKPEKLLVFFSKTENQMLKKTPANHSEHQNPKN